MRYAEWCTSAPSLEADIAAAAMGLDDLGHSRVLYGCLPELPADGDPPGDEADPQTYANVAFLDQPWSEYSQFIAANAVLDSAFTLVIEALADGSVEVLRSRLRKMLQEERYHFLHGRSWLREARRAPAIEQAWREAIEWLGPARGEIDQLQADGKVGKTVADLREALAAQLGREQPIGEPEWSRWDPVRRRSAPGGIDQRTFEMLRGLAERRYMPAGERSGGERADA
jgi:1,2-phenylacetyl-CoA epoxidase catalytic subunit